MLRIGAQVAEIADFAIVLTRSRDAGSGCVRRVTRRHTRAWSEVWCANGGGGAARVLTWGFAKGSAVWWPDGQVSRVSLVLWADSRGL